MSMVFTLSVIKKKGDYICRSRSIWFSPFHESAFSLITVKMYRFFSGYAR